jgi:hypothetical protein
MHPHWCYATSAFHSTDVFDLLATTHLLSLPTTGQPHNSSMNTWLTQHCPYLYKTLVSPWVGKLLFGLSDHEDKGTRMLWKVGNSDPNNTERLETLTPTTQHNSFSFMHLFVCWHSTASMVTTLQTGQSGFKSPWQPEIFFFSRGPPSLQCNRYNNSFSGHKLASAWDWPLTSF